MTIAMPPAGRPFFKGFFGAGPQRGQRLPCHAGNENNAKCWQSPRLRDLGRDAVRLLIGVLASASFAISAQAQSNASGPLVTMAGELQFVRDDRDFVAMLDQKTFDRFGANRLTHFDDVSNASGTIARVIVQTDSDLVLYDFRRRPPLVQRVRGRMTVKRVFWQGDEVVMQGSQGWFRFMHGELTKLQSSTTTYH